MAEITASSRRRLEDDRTFLLALISDQNVRRFLGGVASLEQRRVAVSNYLAFNTEGTTWIVENGSRQIGLISIGQHQDGAGTELSYQFHPDFWGRGYAAEAAKAVKDYFLDQRGRQALVAETQTANVASRHLLEALGMKELRRLKRFGAEQILYIL
ncbi:GNAT family N-acetyltransferase [Agrobacterium rhizogenes]|nr:GNAT family N-acetyltransferase [Rhizobium rhizogenes]NTH62047.1 GNAT family N-acetyltransferase [Rhizobium rhizogenes]NTH93673.1 GNAT family N-acetyltransferase [Rhizobium rhizogenes]